MYVMKFSGTRSGHSLLYGNAESAFLNREPKPKERNTLSEKKNQMVRTPWTELCRRVIRKLVMLEYPDEVILRRAPPDLDPTWVKEVIRKARNEFERAAS